jgi:hypothetical protein
VIGDDDSGDDDSAPDDDSSDDDSSDDDSSDDDSSDDDSSDDDDSGASGCETPDADRDGWTVCDGDCDDENRNVYPGAAEACGNGVDEDCDGLDPLCGLPGTDLVAGGGCVRCSSDLSASPPSGGPGAGNAGFLFLFGLLARSRRLRRHPEQPLV